jgi:hypothetical protein
MEHKITLFSEWEVQLNSLEKDNSTLVFDYATEKGEKEARSHVYKLRQTKTAVDKARKDAKAEQQAYLKAVEAEAQTIIKRLEAMIALHMNPIEEKGRKEAERVAAIREKIDMMGQLQYAFYPSANDVSKVILELEELEIDESYQEFAQEAQDTKLRVLEALATKEREMLKYERDMKELEELRSRQRVEATGSPMPEKVLNTEEKVSLGFMAEKLSRTLTYPIDTDRLCSMLRDIESGKVTCLRINYD